MTGQAGGPDVAVDHDEIQAAEDAIIDAIRARHPEERAQILTRAEAEFVGPAPIAWGELAWAAVLLVVAGLMLVRLDALTERSQGVVVGLGLAVAGSYLWSFGLSVIEHFRAVGQ